jgi:hypothetical protein
MYAALLQERAALAQQAQYHRLAAVAASTLSTFGPPLPPHAYGGPLDGGASYGGPAPAYAAPADTTAALAAACAAALIASITKLACDALPGRTLGAA